MLVDDGDHAVREHCTQSAELLLVLVLVVVVVEEAADDDTSCMLMSASASPATLPLHCGTVAQHPIAADVGDEGEHHRRGRTRRTAYRDGDFATGDGAYDRARRFAVFGSAGVG